MLDTLISVVKAKPKELELCCPDCGAEVELRGGLLHCTMAGYPEVQPHGQSVWRELRHLAVSEETCPF